MCDIEAVGSEALDYHSAKPVPRAVAEEKLTAEFSELLIDNIEDEESDEAPKRLIEESRMNRLVRIHCYAFFGEQLAVLNYRRRYLFAPHSPGRVGICAEGLLIHEVAPASDSLTDKQADAAHIKEVKNIYLSDLADYERGDESADYSAVDGESALPDLRNLRRMELVIVPLEYNIVRTRAYYSRESAVDEHIEHLIEAYAPLVGHSAAEERGEYKAEGDNDPVELDADLVSEE